MFKCLIVAAVLRAAAMGYLPACDKELIGLIDGILAG